MTKGTIARRLDRMFVGEASQTVLFGAVVLTMVVVRFVVFVSDGSPPTIDAGNWLAFGDSFFGGGIRSGSISYPPFVPIFVKLAVSVFGLAAGVSFVAACSAAAPAVGLFTTLSLAGFGRSKLFPSMILLGVGSVGEAASWGGFPQLIAMGLLPIGVLLGHRFIIAPCRATAIAFSAVTFAMFTVSHLVAAVLVVAALVLVVTEVATQRSVATVVAILRWSLVVVAPLLLLLPTYVDLIDAVFVNPNEFADLDNLNTSNFFSRLEGIYVDAPFLWRLLIPLTVISPFLRWPDDRSGLLNVLRSLFIALALLLVVSREGRYLYVLPTLAMLATALWIREAGPRAPTARRRSEQVRLAVVSLAILAVGVQWFAGVRQLDNQRYFYAAMSEPLVSAIEVAETAALPDEVIAIPSVRGAPLGWWVEALADRPVLYGSPLRWLNFADEVERATRANAIFGPAFPSEDTMDLLTQSNVSVIVLPRTWEWFDLDEVLEWIDQVGIDIVDINGDALVLRVR